MEPGDSVTRPENRRRRLETEGATTRARAAFGRRAGIALALAAVAALQIAATRGRLDGPFLDTRLHYAHDNALYGFQIRSGLRDADPRSQFGVTVAAYDRWGEATGRPSYYTDHPFLLKALLQLYARFAGVSEWTTRSFYLLVAAATAAGLFAVLLSTTGSVFAAAAGAATLVTLPVFSVYQLSVKSEADGMLVAVWLYGAFVATLRRGTRRPRLVYATLAVAAFLTHWTVILFVGVLAAYELLLARRHPRARQLLATTAAASAVGLAALLGLMSWLQRGWTGAREALTRSFRVRSQAIGFAEWGARQLLYVQKNFTVTAALLSLAMLGLLVARVVRRGAASRAETEPSEEPSGLALVEGFVLVTAAVAVLWVGLFPQGSFVHVYWQYWFCLPIAALVAATVAMAEGTRLRAPARVAACVLVAALFVAARKEYAGIVADQLGTPEDVAFLQTLRDDAYARLVFVPLTDTPLTAWFQGPLFLYYTDRPIAIASRPEELHPGDKLLVLRYTDRALAVKGLEGWSGRRLLHEKCGLRICAYDVGSGL